MSATECAKKILCREKAQQLMVAACSTLNDWDLQLADDETIAEVSGVYIECIEIANKKSMAIIADKLG